MDQVSQGGLPYGQWLAQQVYAKEPKEKESFRPFWPALELPEVQ